MKGAGVAAIHIGTFDLAFHASARNRSIRKYCGPGLGARNVSINTPAMARHFRLYQPVRGQLPGGWNVWSLEPDNDTRSKAVPIETRLEKRFLHADLQPLRQTPNESAMIRGNFISGRRSRWDSHCKMLWLAMGALCPSPAG